MIVNSFVKRESLDFKKILVCIDFSKSCDYACRFAIKLAQRYGVKVVSVPHVVLQQVDGREGQSKKLQ